MFPHRIGPVRIAEKSGAPPASAMIGVIRFVTMELTTAVNATPMTTATARSTTFPRNRKSLKPLSIGKSLLGIGARILEPSREGSEGDGRPQWKEGQAPRRQNRKARTWERDRLWKRVVRRTRPAALDARNNRRASERAWRRSAAGCPCTRAAFLGANRAALAYRGRQNSGIHDHEVPHL